ncbi:amidohydrolase [Candidatus Micrarchaeota archaeon]|nr:amidohydrolase [Candidatus Micrarchaeota archaeon]
MDILIKNGTIITQNSKREITKADILIRENEIAEVKKSIKEKTEFKIDASDFIILPGLINMHTHVAMAILRGLGEDLLLQEWLNKKIWPAESKLTGKQIFDGTKIGTQEMLLSGVTSFNDMYIKELDQIAEATIKTGLRGFLSRGILDLISGRDSKSEWKEAIGFVEKWKKNKLITPVISCHSIYATSEEMLLKSKEYANKNKLKFHIHISETRKEIFDCLKKHRKRPVEYLDSLGLLDSNTILAHASWVTKREIRLVGKAKSTIVNCPISNLKLATGGICQIKEYWEEGANVTLGTDGPASNNSLNMFETMKLAALLQKHHYWKADAFSTQKILDAATLNAAKALGLNAGSIEKGKLADLVFLDARTPNLMPHYDLLSNLVYSAHPGNVKKVIVDGKIFLDA